MAKTANRRINIFLNSKAVEGSIKDIKKEFRQLNNSIGNVNIGTEEYRKKAARLRELSSVIKQHRQNVRGISTSYNKVTNNLNKFLGVAGLAFGTAEVVRYGKRLFDLSIEMDSLSRKAEIVFGDALPQITAEAEKNATAIGLTTSQYTDAATAIGDLLIPMGFQRTEAASISTELVNLSGALAEWTGGQRTSTEVAEILQKAILGEREQLKTLGISIQEADVKARLAEKGLKDLTGEMLQQAKAAATLELITEKSADAQAAFAANSDTAARRQAELSAKFTDIQEKIATALLPVFERLLAALVPVVDSIGDAISAVTQGTEPVGNFAKIVSALATAFVFAKDTVVAFFQAAVELGNYIVTGFQTAFLRVQLTTQQFANTMINTLNEVQDAIGIDGVRFELFDVEKIKTEIEALKKVKAEVIDINKEKAKSPETNPDLQAKQEQEAKLRRAAEAQRNREEQAKEAERREEQALKELERQEKRLQEALEKFREEARLAQLSEDERKLEELRISYQREIDLAKELEAQGITEATEKRLELERIRDAALSQLRDELLAARTEKEKEALLASEEAKQEALRQAEQTRLEEEAAIKTFVDEITISEREKELQELENQFDQIAALTSENDDLLLDVLKAYRQKKQEINDKFDKEDRSQYIAAQKAQAEALATSFRAAGDVIGGVLELVGEKAVKNTVLGKGLALAQIAISSAEAIAKGTAASAGVPFPGNLVAIASTVATVLGNIAQAKQIISSTSLPQKKEGGWLNATGADDNRTYRAKYIGSPRTGMLPDHPVVLASEVGREYFVSNDALKNPYVMDHVQAIENITRLRQFRDGGPTRPLPAATTPTATVPSFENTQLAAELSRLNTNLERGIIALIDDDEVINIFRKFNQLNQASGGALN